MNQFDNVKSEVKFISQADASLILDSVPSKMKQIVSFETVNKLLEIWRNGDCVLHPIVFINGLPQDETVLTAILRFNHPVPCFMIYNWPAEKVRYQFPKKVVPVVPVKDFLTEEEAMKLWPDMVNFKSIRTLCQAIEFGYCSFNRHFTKGESVLAIIKHSIVAEMILDNVSHNGPARNSYNLAPFGRALVKFPSLTSEILRAVKCFSKMLEAVTKGQKLSRIYQEKFMNTFEDYCLWHKENTKSISSSDMKEKASLYCATALKAFLDKDNSIRDFRFTVIKKDPFELSKVVEVAGQQPDLFAVSSK